MKSRLLIIALFTSFGVFGQIDFTSYNKQYFESNFGVPYLDDFEVPFPGLSFLLGNRKFTSENIFVDKQIG